MNRLVELLESERPAYPETPYDIGYNNGLTMAIAIAGKLELEEVVHGRWITRNKGQNNWCECSECNTVGSPFWKRCPVCEAKMDEGVTSHV